MRADAAKLLLGMSTPNSTLPARADGDSTPDFEPYISAQTRMREFSPRALILGTLLGIIFGASSLYLVLKVGITVSASIPVAVISVALFRLASKGFGFLGVEDSTILENNIVQTAGSAGESIAFGLGVTMPAIMILGFDLEISRIMLVAILGGLLGILMMIPLRRALIVKQHGSLKYPEGTACAVVLTAGASPESRAASSASAQRDSAAAARAGRAQGVSARAIFAGFGIGLVYKSLMNALRFWKDTPEKIFSAPLKASSLSMEISPELLGVGYVIGPRIASIMCAGGALSYLVLIPLIKYFGDALEKPVLPGVIPIGQMGPAQIRSAYILYIGAGAVAAGGIFSLIHSLPTIWHGIRAGLSDFTKIKDAKSSHLRTDTDLSMKIVLYGIALLILGISVAQPLHMNILGALLIVVFGFLFVTVSSRLTGEIGSSSNPISGMTVATLLLTCLIFLLMGWGGSGHYVTALSVGAIVCIAASNGGTTSQDLKTGFLVGSTPKYQQIAILCGALASAIFLGPILLTLNQNGTVYVPIAQVAEGLKTDPAALPGQEETLTGEQAASDRVSYLVWHKIDDVGGPAGKYLVNRAGRAVYLVDPAINGKFAKRPDGTSAKKFDAPKAVLMSYIIKGILDRKLPWGLVLLGAMISVVLEMSGISSLAFAVGVYLPLSSSTPIFVGGLVRWWVDRKMRHRLKDSELTEAQLAAEGDKSPGVLMASGYIAGGALAGIVIAIIAGGFPNLDSQLGDWAAKNNPLFEGPNSDLLALIPFAALTVLLYATGREFILAPKNSRT
jgi:putative OPT family oligopeptide transporter